MESSICFKLSYNNILWGNDSRIEDIKQCLCLLNTLYVNIEHGLHNVNYGTFCFHLHTISHSTSAQKIHSVPQIALNDNCSMQICLRHAKQIATISVADNIDVSMLQTAIFYYLEYYTPKYQLLQDGKKTLEEERAHLKKKVMEAEECVKLLQQREILEDDDLLLNTLDKLHILEERYQQNGYEVFDTIQSIGRLFRFQEV